MPATDADRILAYSVCQVLEIMCFSEARLVSERFTNNSVIATTVGFHGTFSGHLHLQVSSTAAKWLAASFLGIRHEDLLPNSPIPQDTVCELGNVICGRFLSLLDPSADLKIDPPSKSAAIGSAACLEWRNFRADPGLLRVAFQIESNDANSCR